MVKLLRSVAVRLAFKFTIVLTVAVLVLSLAFTTVLYHLIRSQQSSEIEQAAKFIEISLQHNPENDLRIPDLPYYITYLIYSEKRETIVLTNDPFLPLLPITKGKTKFYSQQNYFIDGDLSILYYSKIVTTKTDKYTIQTSLNMERDTSIKLISEVPKTIALVILPILIVSYFISFFISRSVMKPVSDLTQAAKQIGATNLDTLLPRSHSGDELDVLAKRFNELFSRLKKDFDRERQFTSDVSHELKTPLAVVLGQANMLRRWGKEDPALLTKSLTTIIDETKSMEAVINNLLQIGRLESGRTQPKIELINIPEMYRRLKEETISVNANAELNINCPEGIKVPADMELLHQVFMVCISNSLKFIDKEKPVITLNCVRGDGKVIMTIEDNGPGFPEEALEHVFERFYRADTSHTRSVGGSGLGLSIAETIMHAMHGEISAYNANPCGAGIKISI